MIRKMINKKLLIGGGIAAALFGAWWFTRSSGQETTPAPTLPPAPPQPPPRPVTGGQAPPPAPAPMPITPAAIAPGVQVVTVRDAQIYTGKGKNTPYTSGGTGSGKLKSGVYAGTVLEVDKFWNAVRVRNFTYPAKNTLGFVYEYWLALSDVRIK